MITFILNLDTEMSRFSYYIKDNKIDQESKFPSKELL